MRPHDLTRSPHGHAFTMTWALTLAVMATIQQINGTACSRSHKDKEEVNANTKEEESETKTQLRSKDVEQGYSGLEKDVDDPQGVYPELTSDEALKAAKDAPKDTEGGDEEKDDEDPEDVVRPPAPIKMKPQKRAANVLLGKRPRQWPPDVMYKFHDIPRPPKWTDQSRRNVRHQKPLANPKGPVQVIVRKVKEGDTKNSRPLAVYQIFIASKESNNTAVTSSSFPTKSPPVRRRRNAIPETADQPPVSKPLQKGSVRHANPPVRRWQENKVGGEKVSEDDNDDSDSDTVIDEDKLDRTLQKRHSQVETNGVAMKSDDDDNDDDHNDVNYKMDGDIADNHEDNNDDDSYKGADFSENEEYTDGKSEISKKRQNTIRFKPHLLSQKSQIPGPKQKIQTNPHWRRSHKVPVVKLVALQDQEGEYYDQKDTDYQDLDIDSAEEDPLQDSLVDALEGMGTDAENLYDIPNIRRRRRAIVTAAPNMLQKRSYDLRDIIREMDAEEDEDIDTDDDIENLITTHINDEENEENDEMEEIIAARDERGAANVDERKTEYVTTRPKAIANAEENGDVKKLAGEQRDAGRKRERKHADNRDQRVDFTRRKQKRDDSHAFLQAIDTRLSLVPPAARVLPSITPSRADTLHTMDFFRDETRREGKHKKKKREAAEEWWDSPPTDSNNSGGLNVKATHSLSIAGTTIDTIQQEDIKASPADDHTYPLQEEPQEKSDVKDGHDLASLDETVKQEEEREKEDDSNDGSQTVRPQRRQANGNENNNNIPDDSNDSGGFNIRVSHGRPHAHYDNEILTNKLQLSDESERDEHRVPQAISVGGTDVATITPLSAHDALHDMLNIPRNFHDVSPTASPKGPDQQGTPTTASPMMTGHRHQKHISIKTPLSSTPSVTPGAANAAENNSVNTKNYNLSSKANQSTKNLDRDTPSLHAWYNDGNVTAYVHSHGAYREEGVMKKRQKKALLGSMKKKRSTTTGNTGTKRLNLERSAYPPIGKFEIFPPNRENFADKAVLMQNSNKYSLESATDGEDDSRKTPNRSRRSTRSPMRHPLKPREHSGILRNSRRRRSADVGSRTVTSHAPIERRSLQMLDVATRYKDADRTLDDILYNILPEATGSAVLPNIGRELETLMVKQSVNGALAEEDKELNHVMGVLANYPRMPSVVLDIKKGEGRLVSPKDAKFDKIIIRNEREAPKTRPLNHRARAKHLTQEENSLNPNVQKEGAMDKTDDEKAQGFEGEETRSEKINERNTSEKERIMGREMSRGVLKRLPSSILLGSADNDERARIERELQELNNRGVAPSTRNDYAESGARRWHIQHEHQGLPIATAVDTKLKEEATRRDLVALQTAAAVDNAVRKALQKVKERIRRTRNVDGNIIENLFRSDEGGFEATGGKEEGDTDGADVYDSEDEEEDHRRKRNSPLVDEGIDGDVVLDSYRKKRSVSFGTDGAVGSARAGSLRKDVEGQSSGLAKTGARVGTREVAGARPGAGARARAEVRARVDPEVSEETDLNVDDMLLGIKQLVNNVEKESHKVQRILRKVDTFTGRYSNDANLDSGEDEEQVDDEKIDEEVVEKMDENVDDEKIDEEVDDEDDDYVANDEAFADTIIVSAVDKAGQLKMQEDSPEPLVFEEDDDGPNSGYSPWNEWSSCNVSCGFGRRQRSRSCEDISRCTAGNQEEDICMLGPCK